MSMWIRTIAISVTALWLVGCSSVAQRQLAQDAVTAMGGADKLMAIQTLTMSGGTGTRTKVGQAMTATGPDQVGELSNDVETLDLTNGRAAFDYDIKVGDFTQHRHEVLTKFGEGADGKPIGIESIEGVTFATYAFRSLQLGNTEFAGMASEAKHREHRAGCGGIRIGFGCGGGQGTRWKDVEIRQGQDA